MSLLEVEVVAADGDERLIEELARLHVSAFPAHLRLPDPVAYFTEGLRDAGTVNLILRSADRLAGHLLAYPQSSVYRELRQWDPAMEDDPRGLYLEIVQVLPRQRGMGIATRLFERMAREARRRGFTRFSMHARKTNGMDRMIGKLFPESRSMRTVENWLGTDEPFEYIETTTRFVDAMDREDRQ